MYFNVFMHFCCKLANVAKYAFFGLIALPQKLRSQDLFDKSLVFVHQGAVTFLKFPPLRTQQE